MLGRFEPLLRFGVELLHRHAAQRRGEDLLEVLHRELGDRLPVARQHGLEGLDVLQLRLLRHHRRHAVEAVDHLRVHRMLDPDACRPGRTRRCGPPATHELGARPVGGGAHEVEDRLLRRRRRSTEGRGSVWALARAPASRATQTASPGARYVISSSLRWPIGQAGPSRVHVVRSRAGGAEVGPRAVPGAQR